MVYKSWDQQGLKMRATGATSHPPWPKLAFHPVLRLGNMQGKQRQPCPVLFIESNIRGKEIPAICQGGLNSTMVGMGAEGRGLGILRRSAAGTASDPDMRASCQVQQWGWEVALEAGQRAAWDRICSGPHLIIDSHCPAVPQPSPQEVPHFCSSLKSPNPG